MASTHHIQLRDIPEMQREDREAFARIASAAPEDVTRQQIVAADFYWLSRTAYAQACGYPVDPTV